MELKLQLELKVKRQNCRSPDIR